MSSEKTVNYIFNHRHLVVEDVPGTVAFYEETLGATRVEEIEFRGNPIFRLKLGDLSITISGQIQEGVGDHIGLAVDDFDAAIGDLREKGIEFFIEPQDMGVAKVAFIKDNAGTMLEILQFAEQS